MPVPALEDKTIPAMAASAAKRFGDRLAIADGGILLSYSELFERSHSFGASLVASGVQPGDRVAIWAFNCAEWVIAVLGAWHARAVLVPINTRFKGVEAAELLRRGHVRVLVTVTGFLDTDYPAMLSSAGTELPELGTIVVARGEPGASVTPWNAFLARATASASAQLDQRCAGVDPDDPSDILFTSGTTGVPKGVLMTHARTLGVAADWVQMTGLGPEDRYLMVNPYFHMFGLKAGILACLASGATMLPEAVLDVGRLLDRVGRAQVTVLPGPPTLYQSILDHPHRGDYDLSSLRVAVTGAADIPVEMIRRLHDELPFSTIIAGYGLTEAGTVTSTPPGADARTVATTVGRPRPGFEVRIDDGEGGDLPIDQTGEVVVRGGTVMAGYLDDPVATAETLSANGWLSTGDLGAIDDRGFLRIVGRAKDMFIVGGFNVYPAEIENVLLRHPDVRQAAVIGVPDKRLGEVGRAFVVSRSGHPQAATDILAWCREQMANYKAPRVVEVVDELPVSAAGKVLKDDLRSRVAGDRPASPS